MRRLAVHDVEWSNAWNIAVLVVIAVAGLWFMLRSAEWPGFMSASVGECKHAYARASTSADTAAVDVMYPAMGATKEPNAPTCGTLRRVGSLR